MVLWVSGIYMLVVMGMGAASVCLSAITIVLHNKGKAGVNNDDKMAPPVCERKRKKNRAVANVEGIEDLNDVFVQPGHLQGYGGVRIDTESNRSVTKPRCPQKKPVRNSRLAETCNRAMLQASFLLTILGAVVVLLLLSTS